MSIITLILAGIVALEHLYIMYLETFATHSDTTSRVFNMSKEELQRDSVTNLFKNHPIVSYSGITNAEDRMLFIQLISYAKKSSSTHHSCYCYYLNKESNSYPKISNRILKNIIFSNDWCYQYLTEKNVNPKYITKYHLYRIRYLMEIGYKFSDILSITSLDKTIYSLTSVYNNTNFIFSIHYLLLQKIKIYPKWYSHLKKLYYKLL